MLHIMIDLETMGVSHEATIAQIGACLFNPYSATWDEPPREHQFMVNVSRYNGSMDLSTVRWWRGQGGFMGTAPILELPDALVDFEDWLDVVTRGALLKDRVIWSNGPSFDHTILNVAYDRMRAKTPWSYNSARCCRTVFDLANNFGWKRPQRPVAHNGLQDSLDQAREVWQAINFMSEMGS